MDHVSTGIRGLLNFSSVYLFLQNILGGRTCVQRYIQEFVRPFPDAKILDIGCGPGRIVELLPTDVHYVGYDFNPRYIEYAKEKYKGRGEFLCNRVSDSQKHPWAGKFDIVMANATLHHLNDAEAETLITTAWEHLRPGGTFVTFDAVTIPNQPLIAKFLISRDRGQHVRTPEGYTKLVKARFSDVEGTIRTDGLRIPYTHFIMRSTKPTP